MLGGKGRIRLVVRLIGWPFLPLLNVIEVVKVILTVGLYDVYAK